MAPLDCCRSCRLFDHDGFAVLESRYKRLTVGIVILLIVDLIWVASAEVTGYIFFHENFKKPFFTTYFKTAMLSLCLLGFAVYRPWQYQCAMCLWHQGKGAQKKFAREVEKAIRSEVLGSRHLNPTVITVQNSTQSSRSPSPHPDNPQLSDPIFENMTDDEVSTTGSEDIGDKGQRHVRFSRIREIRHMGLESAEAARLARMSHTAVEDLQLLLLKVTQKLPVLEVMKLAFIFSFLWVGANFFYQLALSRTSGTVTNILSSTSGLFTLLLAALFQSSPLDKFTLSKLLAVLVSILGIVLVSWADPEAKKGEVNEGAVFALLGAILYACYLVFLKRKAGSEDNLDIPLFFGFVGLFGAVLFWPMFFVFHYTGLEEFKLPSDLKTWGFLVLNGLVGTVLSELLWLWGCFLTSSLIATLSLGLVIPLTMACDMIITKIKFSWMFIGGVIPVFLSFFAVSALAHYDDWDPLVDFYKKIKTRCLHRLRAQDARSLETEQTERLITVDANNFNEGGYQGEILES